MVIIKTNQTPLLLKKDRLLGINRLMYQSLIIPVPTGGGGGGGAGQCLRFRLRKPRVEFAFLVILFI